MKRPARWCVPMLLAACWAVAAAGPTALGGTEAIGAIDVTDDAGTRFVLPGPAQRIVSLAPSITELLFAIGAGRTVVGTSAFSNYPPQAREIPVVAGADGVDLERIAALHTDLVILWGSGYPPATREALERLGLRVYVIEPGSLESIARSMERLGRVAGAPQGAQQAQAFRARLQQLKARYSGRRPVRVFYQVWPGPLMTLSGRHVVSEAMQLCGGRNIFAALPLLVPSVSPESVIAADPQVILTSEPDGADRGALAFWKRYPFVAAVATGQMYTLDANRIDRGTPRMLDETARMCELIDAARAATTH